MAELVDKGTNTSRSIFLPFVTARILRYYDIVKRKRRIQIPAMGPYRVCRTIISLALSCVKDKDVVNISVTIIDITRKINFLVSQFARFLYHLTRCGVFSLYIAAIIRAVFRKCYRSVDIKMRPELPV